MKLDSAVTYTIPGCINILAMVRKESGGDFAKII